MSLILDLHTLRTPQRVLLRPLRLSVAPGCVHTLMGPSGSGKSSLLAALCGTLPEGLHFDGTVQLAGCRIDGLPPVRWPRASVIGSGSSPGPTGMVQRPETMACGNPPVTTWPSSITTTCCSRT